MPTRRSTESTMSESVEISSSSATAHKSSSVSTTTHDSNATSFDFVDYSGPDVKVLPPAKYKLWLIVFVLVYLGSLVTTEAELLEALKFNGWLSPEASRFVMMGIVLFVMVYSVFDLVTAALTFSWSGTEYGIGPWLKKPRATWVYSHENIVFEVLAGLVHILEEGFRMFDAPPSVTPDKQFECKDGNCQKILKIEHRIKPEKLEEYKKWQDRIRRVAAEHANGLIGVETTEIRKEKEFMTDDHKEQDVEEGSKVPAPPLLAVVYVKFINIEYLNDWMLSPRRKSIMKALESILVEPDVVQIQKDRALPDAMTDLLTRQGNAVPESPPKKWKVWWLTLLALYISIRWSDSFLPYYFDQWGLSSADPRLQGLVSTFIVTFLNSYVTVPLLLFLFDHWVQHSDINSKNIRQPWKALDDGFPSMWINLVVTSVFYGGLLIAIYLKR